MENNKIYNACVNILAVEFLIKQDNYDMKIKNKISFYR